MVKITDVNTAWVGEKNPENKRQKISQTLNKQHGWAMSDKHVRV